MKTDIREYNKTNYNIDFPWGEIKKQHTIGNIKIFEYLDAMDNEITFHPYVDDNDTNEAYETLDKAIIGAIANKYNNCRATTYIFKMLDME